MSIKLQMDVEALRDEVKTLTARIDAGLTEHSEKRFVDVTERLKDMENKYHMLNARLTKYKVD